MIKYSDDFRREVITAARESHQPRSHVARKFGIAPATLNNWISKFYAENPQELEADHQRLQEEQARLLAEQEELRKQLPWLNRAYR